VEGKAGVGGGGPKVESGGEADGYDRVLLWELATSARSRCRGTFCRLQQAGAPRPHAHISSTVRYTHDVSVSEAQAKSNAVVDAVLA
jgi:hypothetical protein